LIEDLETRNLIYQITDREGLREKIRNSPISLYVGFDPTADTPHIGNLLQILLLRRFQLACHHPIAVVGGGIGLIGDPSGKNKERILSTEMVVQNWTTKIRNQLGKFLDFESSSNPAVIVNNCSWLSQLEVIPFLRDIGKYFSVGMMLAKDSIRSRLDSGISYTEFTYMIMQAFDFLHLHQEYSCSLQAGGSD